MPPKKVGGAKKKGSPYNAYMKTQLEKMKTGPNKDLPHKDKFKLVAKQWAVAPENPKNKK